MNPIPGGGGEERVFPFSRLPPGFLRFLDNPPHPPAAPRPSSTLALLRKGKSGLEVLFLKRSPRSGFIPGAWVFPGGTVDKEDGDATLLPRLQGITPEGAGNRLDPVGREPPAIAYWVAALRETFEETGVLLRQDPMDGKACGKAARILARSRLLAGEVDFTEVLEALDISLDAGALAYIGHWLTPECEPRRYDTRFFAAELKGDAEVIPHEREMVDSLWITPADALSRNSKGTFPLVLPTMVTLEELEPFPNPGEALAYLKEKEVTQLLPKPERAGGGVRFLISS